MCTIKTWKRFIAANFAAQKYDPAGVKEFARAIARGSLKISLTFFIFTALEFTFGVINSTDTKNKL